MKYKRFTAGVLAFAMVFGMGAIFPKQAGFQQAELTASAITEGKYGDFTYRYQGTYIEIYQYNGNDEIVKIPSKINNLPVTAISFGAFLGCTNLTAVTMPDSVTEIDKRAFQDCTNLTSVTFSSNVWCIGEMAFFGCENLTDVYYSGTKEQWNAIEIDSNGNSPLLNATIHYNSATPEENLTYKKYDTYVEITGCDENAEIVDIPAEIDGLPVTSIGNNAFAHCSGLSSITLPDGVTNIGDGAFYWCTSLTNITIPYGVTDIGTWAFRGCSSLTSVTIPESVTNIGVDAFTSTPWLEAKQGENPLVIVNGMLIDGRTCFGDVVIPNYVTKIIGDSFGNFFVHSSLTSITIPTSVKSIEGEAFQYCSSLTSVTLPDSVTSIEFGTFQGCTGLTSVTIPDSVTKIEYSAFGYCENLTDVYYSGTEEQWKAIKISDGNEPLTNATIHYNSTTSEQPAEELEISVLSLIELNQKLKTKEGAPLKFDLNGDNVVNVIDLALLKQKLLNK